MKFHHLTLLALTIASCSNSAETKSMSWKRNRQSPKTVNHQPSNRCPSYGQCYGQFGIAAEFLYFKAIEDELKYAQWTPQAPSYNPTSYPLDQHFSFSPGSRVWLTYSLPTKQEIRLNWMYYHSDPRSLSKDSTDFSILAVLALPTYGITQNQLVNHVHGRWTLNINAFDLDVKLPLHLRKSFTLSPSGGIKLGFVNQHISVSYSDFNTSLQPLANTPQHIKGKNNMWGLGPMVGLEGKFHLPCQFGIFFYGGVAGLAGRFTLRTTYTNFLLAPPSASLTLKEHQWRVSVVEQLTAGLDKIWTFCTCRANNKKIDFEIAAGWEVQVWTRQFRLNLFDSFVEPAEGADLTLYGPFARAAIYF